MCDSLEVVSAFIMQSDILKMVAPLLLFSPDKITDFFVDFNIR